MSKVGCGRTLGHGASCVKGYLCDSCEELDKLRSKLEELTAAAHVAVDYVGLANYTHRVSDAHLMIDKVWGDG